MEDWGSFTGVIDDDIVDVVIVDYVRDVWTSSSLFLNTLLLTGWWAAAAHSEALAIRVPLTLKPTIILTLLSHRVLSKLLVGASEWPLLIVAITVDEIVALL